MNELEEAILIENNKYEPEEEIEYLYNLNEGESNVIEQPNN